MCIAKDQTEGTWEQAGAPSDGIEVLKRKNDGSAVVLMKTHAKIDGIPPWVIFEVIANPDIRRLWDKAICNFEILEDIPSEGRSLLYYMVKTPIGVSNRDFLQ